MTQRSSASRRGAAAISLSVLIVLLAAWFAPRDPVLEHASRSADLANMSTTQPDRSEVDLSRLARLRPSEEADRAEVLALLESPNPEVRAAATTWVGRNGARDLFAPLFPRMSDMDWRVRAAAFESVRSLGRDLPGAPGGEAPLRDTPSDERELSIVKWMAAWQASPDAFPGLPELCEAYAPNGRWLVGTTLGKACASCHVPPDEYTAADFAACVDCHGAAHASWARSAHARSSTHLGLRRVDDATKTVVPYDFGRSEGLVCTTCHRPAPSSSTTPLPPRTETLRVPHRFESRSAAASCTACHAETHQEWEAWRTRERPLAAVWPPGEVTWSGEAETRSCVTCHMPATPAEISASSHLFAARRDRDFLMAGLHARVEPPTAGRGPQLVLTNLSGHAYPTGTVRRALRIDVVFDEDDATRAVAARLTASALPSAEPRQPPLAPGEQRRIALPVRSAASRIAVSVVYERNHLTTGALEVRLYHLTESLAAPFGWPTPLNMGR